MNTRALVYAGAAAVLFAVGASPALAQAPAATFAKDVLPILQKNCQGCHRPGEIGPMPLLSYAQARPYARAIKAATQSKKMPPWFADSSVQHYANDMSLSAADISTLSAWADAGAPEGDPKDAPPARTFVDGWNIGTPEKVIQMPEPYAVPAAGTIEYTYIILPTRFTEDTWVQALEIRPGNRTLMHHAVLYERTPDSKWLREYPVGVPFVPAPRPGKKQRSSDGDRTSEGSLADEWLVGYVPGAPPYTLPADTAFLIKANSDFVLQLHYTANGTAGTDQTRIGMVLSKTPPAKRAFIGLVNDGSFVIPAGDPNYEARATATLATDVELLSAGPHMHLRGKAMDMRAVYPERRNQHALPRAPVRFQLAAAVPAAVGHEGAARDEARGRRRVGQLHREPLQPRSESGSPLGRSELGRDAAGDRHDVDRPEGRRHQAVRGAEEEGRGRKRSLAVRTVQGFSLALPCTRPDLPLLPPPAPPALPPLASPLTRPDSGATVPADRTFVLQTSNFLSVGATCDTRDWDSSQSVSRRSAASS